MVRVGFRPWLAFLLTGWGIVAVCFMFINSAWSFYLLRLMLGVFESGAFPAMWYALSEFYPRRRWVCGTRGVGVRDCTKEPQLHSA
jgi:MFS family permease